MPNNFALGWYAVAFIAWSIGVGTAAVKVDDWYWSAKVADIQKLHAQEIAKKALELTDANKKTQDANDDARNTIDALMRTNLESKANDQKYIAQLNDDLRGLRLRLSIPVITASCSAESNGHAGAESTETRADIDPRAATALVDIAGRGDQAIKDLNTCIDAYNGVRDRFKQLNPH